MTKDNNFIDAPQRVFAEAVFVDAWHDEFDEGANRVNLCVDVTFRQNVPVGGELQSPLRFRLILKRAEIIVFGPDIATFVVDRNTVARDAPGGTGRLTSSSVNVLDGTASAEVGYDLTRGPSANARGAAEVKQSQSSKLEISQDVRLMIVTHSSLPNVRGHSWEIKPAADGALEGKPWDAVKEPRMQLVDVRRNQQEPVAGKITVEVRCRREDLDIQDIELKRDDNKLFRDVWSKNKRTNNRAAAEGYILSAFERAGLDIELGQIHEKFVKLILSRVTAQYNAEKPPEG